MKKKILFMICCFMAALIPFWHVDNHNKNTKSMDFPGWPVTFQGIKLQPLPFTETERVFYRNYPGKANKFLAGNREIIIRWVTGATRKLHPAVECFRGTGYQINYLPLYLDSSGTRWGSFMANGKNQRFLVYERIYDIDGRNWTDVSSWYWAALLGEATPPWWAITVIESK